MFNARTTLLAVLRYFWHHPEEVIRQLKNAARLRLGVPIAALQWLVYEFEADGRGPKDVEITASPPGLRVAATVEQMGTLIRADCVVFVERVLIEGGQARVELRLKNVMLKLLDESAQTPLAALIRSGTLDLTRLASLVAHLPSRPVALIEASDDRLVIDLMKLPNRANEERVRRIIGMLASVVTIETVETANEHIDVVMKAHPSGVSRIFR
jgi:hypothetical protein